MLHVHPRLVAVIAILMVVPVVGMKKGGVELTGRVVRLQFKQRVIELQTQTLEDGQWYAAYHATVPQLLWADIHGTGG